MSQVLSKVTGTLSRTGFRSFNNKSPGSSPGSSPRINCDGLNKFPLGKSSEIQQRIDRASVFPDSRFEHPMILNGDALDSFFISPVPSAKIKSCQIPISIAENPASSNSEIKENNGKLNSPSGSGPIINACGIQMLSNSLHHQIFQNDVNDCGLQVPDKVLSKIKDHLTSHDLWGRQPSILPEVDFKLPPLLGGDLTEHFKLIAEQQSMGYREKLLTLIEHQVPEMPSVWNFAPGWTRYEENGDMTMVDFPDEEAYVFDVEVCVKEGQAPTLATALSNHHWYSWCSYQLVEQQIRKTLLSGPHAQYTLRDLIPLETRMEQDRLPVRDQKQRLVVGHNVSYDRVRIKEQYFYEGTKMRFIDTMSMHIAVSGVTSYQRMIMQATKNGTTLPSSKNHRGHEPVLDWKHVSSLNGLRDVHQLYCGGAPLEKEERNVFVTGSLADIKTGFQELVAYCARDTLATHRVLAALTPQFLERFPHPVTLAGFLEMGTAFLPINNNWTRYTRDSEDTYADLEGELTHALKREVDAACQTMVDGSFRRDPWLWDLDWSVQQLKIKKTPAKKTKHHDSAAPVTVSKQEEGLDEEVLPDPRLVEKFRSLMATKEQMFKRSPLLPGYPAWYRTLCHKDDQDGLLGPSDISTSAQVVPKLLKLTWDGYPLHYSRQLGWGYLVPGRPLEYCSTSNDPEEAEKATAFPLQECLQMFPPRLADRPNDAEPTAGLISPQEAMQKLERMTAESTDPESLASLWQAARRSFESAEPNERKERKERREVVARKRLTADRPAWHQGIGPYDVGLPGCWFFRLPHKSGVDNNVGNPLAKDYLNKMEDGTLRATSSHIAQHVLLLNRFIIYWRNARDRVFSQMVVRLQRSQLPRYVTQAAEFDPADRYGTILPQVVTSGTLTRRAVESTWMTASNAYQDRLGSELKAMIQCPPGLTMVGADVDSQELWIASVIGDAHFAGQHGCTALGWMTLQGKKSQGTDMHSRTASAACITRDQAKVMNYGRIYGAGERFAKTLLMQFNHRLDDEEAGRRARRMYAATKGTTAYRLNSIGRQLAEAVSGGPVDEAETWTPQELSALRRTAAKDPSLHHLATMTTEQLVERKQWTGGTESHMFNKLEAIAQSARPTTPVLGCRISRALEPANVGNEFMTSRINWVVQSSAVDYLHLMLVAMRYLLDTYRINGRFCISVHDEVRYVVRTEDRFRAALALQITNLWTRCLFAQKLKIPSLPQSVAFFSSVDVDSVLRKEVHMDCQTPSNPYGLKQGYGIPFGKSYDIHQILEATNGGVLDP